MSDNFSTIAKSTVSLIGDGLAKVKTTAYDLLDPANARRAISGLLPGGASSETAKEPQIGFVPSNGSSTPEEDWRVRISLAERANIFYKDVENPAGLLQPLIETNGVIFPYTPSITVSHVANYSPSSLTHSNYAMQFYNNSEVSDISITGDFTVQNATEGQYLMAAVYYFRACTRMFFGQGANAGQPPPIVFLDGYGSHYFPHVPCVIVSFSHTLPNDVDYIQVPINTTTVQTSEVPNDNENIGSVNLYDDGTGKLSSNSYAPDMGRGTTPRPRATTRTEKTVSTLTTSTRLPTASSITVTLRPVYSRKNLHDNFDLGKFATGQLLGGNGSGGFL